MSRIARLALPFVALALLLAGCTAQEPAAPAATSEEAAPVMRAPEPGPEEETPVPPEPAQATPPANDSAAEATSVETLSWSGKLGTRACVPTGPGSCRTVPPVGSSDARRELDLDGRPLEASVVMTWTPASPLTETLVLHFVGVRSCGEDCTSIRYLPDAGAKGTSPLTVEVASLALEPDETLGMEVATPRALPSPLFAFATTDQDFEVEGSLLVLSGGA